MTAALLDVNVLIALAWPHHVHHEMARSWFMDRSREGWATTPVTELGFVRVSSNKKIIPEATTPRAALSVLRSLCDLRGHAFWPDDRRLLDPALSTERLGAYRQVTDIHLALIAVRHSATLATFDRGIVEVLDPADRSAIELLS
ncbi:MAG: TA system VapC family ribonuclease toxin [Sciscionella sp.]